MRVTCRFYETSIPHIGNLFTQDEIVYKINSIKFINQLGPTILYELELVKYTPVKPGEVRVDAISYATEEVKKLRSATYSMSADYSDFEIAKRAYMAGVISK